MKPIEIGTICNYYGTLQIFKEKDKYYWGIENYNGTEWEEIPERLYKELSNFERNRKRKLSNNKQNT